MSVTETRNVISTIPIKNLKQTSSVNGSNIMVIEDDSTTYQIKAEDLGNYFREEAKDTFIQISAKGTGGGIAPLNSNRKIEPVFLTYGKTAGTAYEGNAGKILEDSVTSHTSDKNNPHGTTKSHLGLGNVENKSSDTIRSELTAENVISALGFTPETDGTYEQAAAYVDTKISELIDNAPETLNTLKEIADALSENQEVMDTLNQLIAKKANQAELDTHTGNGTIHVTATDKDNLSVALSHAQSLHARADAVKAEHSTINGNLTINDNEVTVYEHPLSNVTAGTYLQLTVDTQGHVTGGSNPILPITQGGTGASTSANALKNLGLTATALELNTLDGLTATTAELNALTGVRANLQEQLDDKASLHHGNHLPDVDTTTFGQFLISNGTGSEFHKLNIDDITEACGYTPGTGSNVVTAVKGDAETEYKTGNVNITPESIGLGKVNNTADAEKSVASAAKLATGRQINGVAFNGTKDITIVDNTKLPLSGGTVTGTITVESNSNVSQDEDAGGKIYTPYISSEEADIQNLNVATKLALREGASITSSYYDSALHGHSVTELKDGAIKIIYDEGQSDLSAKENTAYGYDGITTYNTSQVFTVFDNNNNKFSITFEPGDQEFYPYPSSSISLGNSHRRWREGHFDNIIYYGSISAASSMRYKENISELTNEQADKLMQLRPVEFDYKESETHSHGLIAEEVYNVFPEIVTLNEDMQPDAVQYVNLIPYLIKKIQMQDEKINSLEKRLKAGNQNEY